MLRLPRPLLPSAPRRSFRPTSQTELATASAPINQFQFRAPHPGRFCLPIGQVGEQENGAGVCDRGPRRPAAHHQQAHRTCKGCRAHWRALTEQSRKRYFKNSGGQTATTPRPSPSPSFVAWPEEGRYRLLRAHDSHNIVPSASTTKASAAPSTASSPVKAASAASIRLPAARC